MAYMNGSIDWDSDGDGDGAAGSALDVEFASTMRRVEAALQGAPRSVRIRGEQWVQRLALLAWVPQEEFRRDRNLHTELLLQCIEEGHWTEPLDRHPPAGPLPKLPPYTVCALRRRRQELLESVRVGNSATHASRHAFASEEPMTSASNFMTSPAAASLEEDVSVDWLPADSADFAHPQAIEKCTSTQMKFEQSMQQFADLKEKLQDSLYSEAEMIGTHGDMAATGGSGSEGKSLAGLAAQALGAVPASGTGGGVSTPLAYSTLAARVVHLQDENRRLRRQLSKASGARAVSAGRALGTIRRSRPSSAGRVRNNAARGRGPFGGAASTVKASPQKPEAAQPCSPGSWDPPAAHREFSASTLPRGRPSGLSTKGTGLPSSPLLRTSTPGKRSLSPPIRGRTPPPLPPFGLAMPSASPMMRFAAPLGPAPPEGDTDGFLRYLDAFQEHSDRLCSGTRKQGTVHREVPVGSRGEAHSRQPRSGL